MKDTVTRYVDSDGATLRVSQMVQLDGYEVKFLNANGSLHRLDGPAYCAWSDDGQLLSEIYSVESKRHRIDGPAATRWYRNGQCAGKSWYLRGVAHRLDGPAFERWHEDGKPQRHIWWVEGKRQRVSERLRAASDSATPPKRLVRLARSIDPAIALLAANNASCPDEAKTLWALTQSGA